MRATKVPGTRARERSRVTIARDLGSRIKAYIALCSCGDPACDTCKVGVAIGLKALDRAFTAGAKSK